MINLNSTSKLKKLQHTALAFVVLIGLSACASTPNPPNLEIQAAELAIANAEQASVAANAAPELQEAREKLSAARAAIEQKEMISGRYLATEATANAELASAKSEMIKSKAVNDEMLKSIDALKQELQRNSGAQR